VLRRLLIQNFLIDARGRFRPRTERDGLPPSRIRIESPYETGARWVRRGFTCWTGYLVHVTATCDEDRVNGVTDVEYTTAGDPWAYAYILPASGRASGEWFASDPQKRVSWTWALP
jgi:hypothetical protein